MPRVSADTSSPPLSEDQALPSAPPLTPLPFYHAIKGFCASSVEMTVFGQPLVYLKNRIQQGKPISRNPRVWYRGYLINLGNANPIVATQMATYHVGMTAFRSFFPQEDLHPLDSFVCAGASGVAGACIACPTELTALHQQNDDTDLFKTLRKIVRSRGIRTLYRGFYAMVWREAIFATGYLAVTPYATQWLRKNRGYGDLPAMAGGTILGGTVSAYLSQPLDVVKITVQKDLSVAKPLGIRATFQRKIAEEGLKAMYRGALPRNASIIMAAFIYNVVSEKMDGIFLSTQTIKA